MHRIADLSNALIAVATSLLLCAPAHAFTVTISSGNPRAIYLQVGVGSFSGLYNSGGTPQANPTVNVVSATVPVAAVGSGTAQAMTSNTGATSSFYDNFVFCSAGQLYVGGFYRFNNNNNGAGATLTANSSVPLVNATGETIPFTQVQWTSSGNGDSGAQPFPAGTFTGGTQTIGHHRRNQWAESCHTFSYRNTAIVPAGTFTGTRHLHVDCAVTRRALLASGTGGAALSLHRGAAPAATYRVDDSATIPHECSAVLRWSQLAPSRSGDNTVEGGPQSRCGSVSRHG